MRSLSICSLIVVLLFFDAFTPVSSDAAAAPPPPAEFAQPQSPTKPEPFPIKMVDQAQFDSKLKGYFLPEGFKLEIVIDEPDVINPVGMTFAPDGTLFVMEWRPDPVTGDKWFEVKETFRYRDGTTRQVATMKKFTTDLVKQFTLRPRDRKVRHAEDHHRRGTSFEHPVPRRLALRYRPRHRAALAARCAGRHRRTGHGAAGESERSLEPSRDHRSGLLRLPPPPSLRPDHRQRRTALHHKRRRRQLRGRFGRQPRDRAPHRGRVPLQAGWLEDGNLLARLPQPVPRPRLRRQIQLVPRR